jgi:hypothetical protein
VPDVSPWAARRPRVFGIGLNKTGTSSFHAAMGILGLRSLHGGGTDWGGDRINSEVRENLRAGRPLLSGVDQTIDAFSDLDMLARHFDKLDPQYPGSRFVLTIRPENDWIDSRRRHVERNIERRKAGTYDGSFLVIDEPRWREQWNRHVDRARRYFADRPDFLEIDLTAGSGWEPLCELLDLPVPDEPFPWANRDEHQSGARGA